MGEITKIPTISDLVEESEESLKDNALAVLLNQPPPEKWLKNHPIISGYRYLPIERVEYLLTRIFTKWWVEVKDVQVIANSVSVTVRLYVINPVSKQPEYQEGVGAAPIQTEANAGAMDWNKAKTSGVQMALPMAKTYAVKDAAEQFGKLFGKDVARKSQIDYNNILKSKADPVDPFDQRVSDMIDKCNTTSELALLHDDAVAQVGGLDNMPLSLVDKFNEKENELARL